VNGPWTVTVTTVQGSQVAVVGVEDAAFKNLEAAWGDPGKPLLVFHSADGGFTLVPRDQVQLIQVRGAS
jgi:hypothetical protein